MGETKEKTCSPTLSYPDPYADFILDTDANDQGIGAVLSQVIEGQEKEAMLWKLWKLSAYKTREALLCHKKGTSCCSPFCEGVQTLSSGMKICS